MKQLARLLVVLVLLIGTHSVVFAQGGSIAYGDTVSDLYNGTPIIYTFDGNENDVVTIYGIGESSLLPTLALSQSNGQPVAFSSGDSLSPMKNDTRITAQLPADDTYIITLSSQEVTTGRYFLSLSIADTLTSITVEESISVTIAPDGTAQQFIIPASSDAPQSVSIIGLQDPFTALLQVPGGEVIASIAGGVDEVMFALPPVEGDYVLTVDAADSSLGTEVQVVVGDAAPPTVDDTSVDEPVATEEVESPPPTDACVVTAVGVNVRSGPGTNYDVIGSLGDGDEFIATGQNAGWYNGTYNGRDAWVASGVVNASGNCNNLALVSAPALQVAPTTAVTQVVAPTATTAVQGQPTTPPQQQQPTSTPPPPPTNTSVPFTVTSIGCRYFINDGATVDYRVEGPPSATFTIEVRFGSTVYSRDRTTNDSGFRSGNETFGQAGNNNYVAYIVYNGVDVASAEC